MLFHCIAPLEWSCFSLVIGANTQKVFVHLDLRDKLEYLFKTSTTMFIRSIRPSSAPSVRCFSSSALNVLKAGDVLRQTRVFSEEDVLEFSKVSHDSNPLHFDSKVARNAGFEDRLVHGMLVAALFPRIISFHFPGAVYVSQSLNFRLPVNIGDKVTGEVQAMSLKESKRKYIVKFKTKCFKNDEILVLDGEAMAILPSLAVEQVHSLD